MSAARGRNVAVIVAAAVMLATTVTQVAAQETVQYGYDALGRVISVTYGTGTTIAYTYDAAGNRIQVTTGSGGGGGGNQNPVAVGDHYEVRTSTTTVLAVLANDSDPNGNPLHVSAITPPAGGTAMITSGGAAVSYVAPTIAGTYVFNYTANDGQGGTAVASVEVLVKKPAGYCQRYPDDPYC